MKRDIKNTKEETNIIKEKNQNPTDRCWETGVYTDDCICDFCSHKEICSGYDYSDDE